MWNAKESWTKSLLPSQKASAMCGRTVEVTVLAFDKKLNKANIEVTKGTTVGLYTADDLRTVKYAGMEMTVVTGKIEAILKKVAAVA